MNSISFTIIAVAFITAAFFTWFFLHKSREEERRFLIEQGVPYDKLPERIGFKFSFPWLKIGLIVTFGAVGTFLGVILMETEFFKFGGEPILLMLIFGGLGMIVAYYVDKENRG